jgi:hypothetical protein
MNTENVASPGTGVPCCGALRATVLSSIAAAHTAVQ